MNYLNNIYKKEKETLGFKKATNLLEGILLIIICIIAYEYDQKLGTPTLLYSFPIMLLVISTEYIMIADKYKKLAMKNWLVLVIGSILLSSIAAYVVIFNNMNQNIFMILLGTSIIIKNAIEYFTYYNKNIIQIVKNALLVLIAILLIIFKDYILINLVLYLNILFAIIAIIKIIFYFLIKKIK